VLITRNIRRLDSSTNDHYRVLQDPNRLAWAWSRVPFQRNGVRYPRGFLLSRGLGSGKKVNILVNGLCAVIHQYSPIHFGRSHAQYRLDESRVDQFPAVNGADPNSNNVQICEYRLHYAIRLLQSAKSGNSLNKANNLEILHMVRKQRIPFSKYGYSRHPK